MANALTTTRKSALALMPDNLDQAIRLAELMASGDLVPDHLKGNPGNCLLVVERAMGWYMSPFGVAQCTFVHKGKLGYEGKLVHAAVEAAGLITDDGFDAVYDGEGMSRKITLTATKVGQTKPKSIDAVFETAHTTDKYGKVNPQWEKDPDQMLYYYAVRKWTRRHTPGVLVGVYTRQEIDQPDVMDYDGPTIDATAEEMAEEAIVKAGDDVAIRAKAEAEKPVVRIYHFTTLKASRACSKPEEWIADWRNLLEGYVSAAKATGGFDDILDRVHKVWNMNKGSLEAIIGFDRSSYDTVISLIKSTLDALKPKVTPQKDEQHTVETDPRDNEPQADQNMSAEANGQSGSADLQSQTEPTDEQKAQKIAEDVKSAVPSKAEEDKAAVKLAENVARAEEFVVSIETSVRSYAEAVTEGKMGQDEAGERASSEINNRATQSKLARMKREGMPELYKRALKACSNAAIINAVLRGSDGVWESFHYDLARIAEQEAVG